MQNFDLRKPLRYNIRIEDIIQFREAMMQEETQKITAHIPVDLLKRAQESTGKGITETVKLGLERVALDKVYEDFLSLQGTYDSKLDLDELRKDKGEE